MVKRKIISFSLEQDLLESVDSKAKEFRCSRSQMISRSVKNGFS